MAAPELTARILRRLLASGLRRRAERLLARIHAADFGPLLSDLEPDEIETVLEILFAHQRAAEMLSELPPDLFRRVVDAVGDERLGTVLAQLPADDLAHLVTELPGERREAVIAHLPEESKAHLRQIELYPERSAGRVMTTDFVALDAKMTAQEAIDFVRARGADQDAESVLYLYVVDDEGRLRGVVPIRRLVTSAPERRCGELMIPDAIRVRADTDQEQAAAIVARYNLLALPVTDEDDHMLGVITVDDVIDVIREEATEDIYRLAGLHEEEHIYSPVLLSVRKRLPWMVINLATCFLAAGVVGLFERAIEQVVLLAVFMPVVAGMAGNAGIQALTVVARGIALGEAELSSAGRAVVNQSLVGLLVGAATGGAAALIASWWGTSPVMGAVVFAAIVVSMTVASLSGAGVPLVLKALGQDPALGSGVIVTTFTDAVGFLSFLGIATLALDHLL
ncbi:magnesium transporter [Myxococcota bacterium]|nr:magnesium transporter [Myxococcota bacterium]MCZ7619478.1 magnesium transporter [Myxococcota bacterium]